MSSKRSLCQWAPPTNSSQSQLKLYNSLTRSKEIFVPQNGNKVSWYSCGPTVYDTSHMGHARSYISFDILRRILQDYFKYDVTYCMNITDLDDKIIKRARQNKLFTDFKNTEQQLAAVLDVVKSAMEQFDKKLNSETDPAKLDMMKKIQVTAEQATADIQKVVGDSSSTPDQVRLAQQNLLENVKSPLSEWLDQKYGSDVTDNEIFYDLPKHFEAEFFADMESLNILPPDVLTRVTEYVPEIVKYIEKIIENGFAYEANGSVYFMSSKFNQDERHFYAKLVPEAFGDADALQEGEGDLTVAKDVLSEKRSPTDFALWKMSKAGEPSWESPWGKGRPGWHIECSAMASIILGDSIDIHTGGYDLKFPHHDNELAQAEAFYGHSHWVRYFLHSGHLTINGMKMSKSLKNFTTIREALEKYTATQIRFAYLLHSWKDTLDYSPNTMEIALTYEKSFKEFFLNMKSILRQLPSHGREMHRKWGDMEAQLNQKLENCKEEVHTALCDSVDTRSALECMKEMMTHTNIYVKDKQMSKQLADYMLIRNISAYLTDMLKIFGTIESDMSIGFAQKLNAEGNTEEVVMPFLDCVADFRKAIRKNAAAKKDVESLRLCDELRDDVLPYLGVRMEDIDNDTTAIKLVDKEILIKEREENATAKEQERLAKEAQRAKAAAAKEAKDAQRKIPPSELFVSQTAKYSKFDDKGLPTHDADGKELSKSQLKKLQKLYDAQAKLHNEFLKEIKEN